MSSTPAAPTKAPSAPTTPNHSPSAPATSNPSFENNRRPAQGPSHPQAAPRKGQAARKQHRAQRKPAMGGNSRHVDEEDAMAEIRALRNTSSRRGQTSITHLLNYALPPRETYNNRAYSRSYRRNPSWGVGSGYHAADKARYIHANYRFVVNPAGNYAEQAADADKHIDWNDVLQVIASAESQQTSCPICLSEPVAPRMAKCGHIFCLACLMRFMNTHTSEEPGKKQNRWRKCPICEDTVYLTDVRPVRFYAGQESPLPRVGDDVILRLMMRSSKGTQALPREGAAEVLQSGEDVPWHFEVNVLDYARIMKGTSGYMAEQFDREIEDLLKQEQEDELLYHEDNEWTQRAIRAIKTAKEKLSELADAEKAAVMAKPAPISSGSKQPTAEQDYYFYTSPPHLYLSPLDIRILKTKYGSFSAFPSTLLPRVEHISMGHVVDDALRKRAKYLGHLPRGCLISFLECDWTDIVPEDILATFKDEIERRRRRNREKEAQEERERLQAERLEAAALREVRRQSSVTVRFSSSAGLHDDDHPPIHPEDFVPLGQETGTTPPNPRPGFGSLSSMSTSPTGPRTVWGTPLVGAPPEPVAQRREEVDDGWLKPDEVLETLETAGLVAQMEALGVDGESAGQKGASGGGGKKKKKQKITLMSTGGRRGI
ncbi:hypothetical protein VTJ04DRAFT_9793 [Mycothermus thermophilus]|uniref:uncharacterized protein n=1 Tax=Humicola insolens TaxID=85995 RepID=UPI00374221DF